MLRLLVTFASSIFLLILLLYLALAAHDQQNSTTHQSGDKAGSLRDFFNFRNPGSLFSPAATISLTDDNSTFFAARPAAFGPLVPTKGLSGQIWIGSGFRATNVGGRDISATLEGELGCNDVLQWDDESSPGEDHVAGSTQLPSEASQLSSSNNSELCGKVALLTRGACSFSAKVKWAQRRGASAVIIGDNVRGGPLIRMYAHGDASNITIPSLFTSHTTAQLLSSLVPPSADENQPLGAVGTIYTREDAHRHTSATAINLDGQNDMAPDPFRSPQKQGTTHGISDIDRGTPTEVGSFHQGLWVTLSLSGISTSPFFNTLFVLVVSPLITLAIVYTMLLIRSRIRRRRWRAPKSVVDKLPVRIYRALSCQSSPTATAQQSGLECSERSALLPASSQVTPTPTSTSTSGQEITNQHKAPSCYGSLESATADQEKVGSTLSTWPRKLPGKQLECAVCLEEYVDGISKIMSLPCGHEYHVDCM